MTYSFSLKTKGILGLFILYSLISIGLYWVISLGVPTLPGAFPDRIFLSKVIYYAEIVIFVWILLFALILLFFYFKRSYDKSFGLFIDDNGIDMNTYTLLSIGKVDWQEITGVEIIGKNKLRFLSVKTKDPNVIISRQSKFKQLILRKLLSKFGSSVLISQASLNTRLSVIENIITDRILNH